LGKLGWFINRELKTGKDKFMQGGNVYSLALMVVVTSLVSAGCKSSRTVELTEIPKGKTVADNGGGNNGGSGGGDNGGPGGGNTFNPPGGGGGTDNPGGGNSGQPVIDRVTLSPQTVHFDYDSAALRPMDMPKVQAVAQYLTAQPFHIIVVEGHCDERGTEQYNISLGEQRALMIRDELVRHGIDASRVRWISYGEEHPVVTGSDDKSFKENRRGEFVVVKPGQAQPVLP